MEALETDPLQLIVQHPSIKRNPQQICRLLSTSKGLRAGIAARCNGQLSVKYAAYDIQRVKHFALWLQSHGHLLKSLQLDLNLTGKEWTEAEAAVAAALQRADSTTRLGLQLQTYRSYPACAGAVLQYLPCWHLKHLDLGPRAEYCSTFALEGLTGLLSLGLHGDSADILLPAVAPLTRLTRLALHDVAPATVKKLKWVPVQLLELHMSLARIKKAEALPPLALAHLTALTQLSSDGKPLLLQAGDVLPSGLRVVRVRDCLAAAPLLGLSQLQVLEMNLTTTPAEELLAISASLPGLQEVALCYSEMSDAAAAAPAWSALPLRSLDFRAVEGCVSSSTLQQLAKLQGLTCLDIYGGLGCCRYAGKFEATPQQFAAVLGQMSGLQELGLRGFELLPEEEQEEGNSSSDSSTSSSTSSDSSSSSGAASDSGASNGAGAGSKKGSGLSTVMEAIARLPQLNSLTFCAIYSRAGESLLAIDHEAATHLAAATQLTKLCLCDCGLQDSAVNTIAASLKGLRKLRLDCNPGLTGDVLPLSVAKELSQLSELCVLRTGIRKKAEGFRARLVSLHPGLTVKSSAR